MAGILPSRNLELVSEASKDAVIAHQTAEEIISLDLICLGRDFPDFELGSRIKVTQRGIQEQAEKYHGDVLRTLSRIVHSIYSFAQTNQSFSQKIFGTDTPEVKKVTAMLEVLIGDVDEITGKFVALQGTVGSIRLKVGTLLKELNEHVSHYRTTVQSTCCAKDSEDQTLKRLEAELDMVEKRRKELWWEWCKNSAKILGFGVFLSLLVGGGTGLLLYAGLSPALSLANCALGFSLLNAALPLTGGACAIGGTGAGCINMAAYTYYEHRDGSFDANKEYYDLIEEAQKIRAQLHTLSKESMKRLENTQVLGQLESFQNLVSDFHGKLGCIVADWESVNGEMKETVRKLKDGEKLAFDFGVLKRRIKEAESHWCEVVAWANAQYTKDPSQDTSVSQEKGVSQDKSWKLKDNCSILQTPS
jgi:hypothetical protein